MRYAKEALKSKTKEELESIVLELQGELKVAEAWWEYEAKEKVRLFEKLHGTELSEE